jgi:hypothetical protein
MSEISKGALMGSLSGLAVSRGSPGLAHFKDGGVAAQVPAATARFLWTSDSIGALDDATGPLYWDTGFSGGGYFIPPYAHQGVSGSEINEPAGADPVTNVKDLLLPTRKQLLEDAVQDGDIVGIMIGTNSITNITGAQLIDGLKKLYAGLIDQGAFICAYTIQPSASNAGADLDTANAFIADLESTGFTYDSVTYPGWRFCVVDAYTAWGGLYDGNTDNGDLHQNTNGALLRGQATRTAMKARGWARHNLYGTSNPAANVLTDWNLAAGTAGTASGTSTFVGPGGIGSPVVPTGYVVAASISGITVQCEVVSAHDPDDSLFDGVAAFPVLKLTVTGTAGAQGDITITDTQSITTEPAGSAYDASAYAKWKGIGATADPTALFAFGFGYGSVVKWSSNNSSTTAGYTNVTLGGEAVMRGRSVPAVQAFGSSSIVTTLRIRSGETASFEFYYGQPYAARAERTAYAVPKSLHTDQAGIGGSRATGPQVGTSNTSFNVANGVQLTGRPGLAWFGGNLTFQFTWIKIGTDGVTETIVSGPTAVTTTASTLQYTPSGFITGEKLVLEVTATNSFGSATARSVQSNAHA